MSTTCAWPTCSGRGLGLPPGDSAIVSTELPGAEERLRGSPVMAAARAGLLRTSWHLYNSREDVERILELLSPGAARRPARGSAQHEVRQAGRDAVDHPKQTHERRVKQLAPVLLDRRHHLIGERAWRRAAIAVIPGGHPSHSWSCREVSISPG